MKKTFFGVLFAVALFCVLSCTSVFAKNYNVKLSVSLLSADSRPGDAWITVEEEHLSELIAFGNVEYYEEDILAEFAEYTENDPSYSTMWEHPLINSEGAWEKGALGDGICVAVIDSGANNHEELLGRIAYTCDYVNGGTDVTDNIGHGTAVAGVIAANRGNGKGFSGVAPRCSLAVLKVADIVDDQQVGPYISDVSDAIEDAVDLYGCRVINLSLGAMADSKRLKDAVDHAVSKGAVVVAATGNDSKSSLRYPAKYDNVMGVGAVGSAGMWATFSNYGEGINVVAPGNLVNTLSGTSGYGKKNGTSFSTPYVAGVCASMLSADSSLDAQSVVDIIERTAKDDAKNDGYDEYYGYGIVDLGRCIDEVIKNSGIYISRVDKEDADKSVFVTNTSFPDDNFVLVLEMGKNKELVDITVKKGESAEIPLSGYEYDKITNLFAVKSTDSAFSISKNALLGLSFVPSSLEKNFSLFVTDKNDTEMTASLSEISFEELEKCNITVKNGENLLYVGEIYAPDGDISVVFDTKAKELSEYAKAGESFVVTVWGKDTKTDKSFVFGRAGDVDENGIVSTDDLVIVRRMIAGLLQSEAFRFHEVNLDGIFNTDDLVALRKIIAGLM